MKKTILTKVCALLSVFAIAATTGCDALSGMLGGSSVQENSEVSEVTSEVSETPENPDVSETPETPEEPENPGTSETPETPEDPGTSETPDDGGDETPETPETPEEPEIAVTLNLPTEAVVPYQDTIYNYLTAGAGAHVRDYYQKMDTQAKAVSISWTFSGSPREARKFRVEYATMSNFADAITVETESKNRSIEVYNL
ncbi:MAG: hypothetical protein IKZ28_01295, partial [Clostridia bacterium]|nr:hypothetical protein [Clostridia bacterium]